MKIVIYTSEVKSNNQIFHNEEIRYCCVHDSLLNMEKSLKILKTFGVLIKVV